MTVVESLAPEAEKLHYEAIVVNGCCHYCEGYTAELAKTGLTVLTLTIADPDDDRDGAIKSIAGHYRLIRDNPKLRLIERVEDIHRAKAEGVIGTIMAFQNARPMALDPTMVELFYRLGVRVAQLAYSDRSFAADGCGTDADAGLSRQGRELVREMNQVGMVVDLSHVGDRSALEAIEISEKPPIFSHSNPRSRVAALRNITDTEIKNAAAKGGVIGLTVVPMLNWRGGDERPTLSDYLDNVEHVVNLVGIDHVAFSTDMEITAGAYPREQRRRLWRKFVGYTHGAFEEQFKGRTGPGMEISHQLVGFRGHADLPRLTQGLLERGYDHDSVRKFLGLNLLRVFGEVWQN